MKGFIEEYRESYGDSPLSFREVLVSEGRGWVVVEDDKGQCQGRCEWISHWYDSVPGRRDGNGEGKDDVPHGKERTTVLSRITRKSGPSLRRKRHSEGLRRSNMIENSRLVSNIQV